MKTRLVTKSIITNLGSVLRPGIAVASSAALPIVGVIFLGAYGSLVLEFLGELSLFNRMLFVILAGGFLAGTALFPTHAISLLAGWLFGGFLGSVAALTSVAVGALFGFFLGGRLAGGSVVELIRSHAVWSKIYDALMDNKNGRASLLIALLRVSPLAPFAATNVAFAALGTPLIPFISGSILGMAPRVLVVVFLGASLAEFNWDNPGSPYVAGFGILATIVALWIITRIAKAQLEKHA